MKHGLFNKIALNAVVLAAFTALTASAANVAKVNGVGYETLVAAIAAAEPVDGVVTYEICGKAEVSATGWIPVLKSGLANVAKVAFVGTTEDAEICITEGVAILADEKYDIDVSFKDLKLSKQNTTWADDYGHSTNYFTTWLRNTNAAENTVTYENCTFPNGACNNQYGKTVYTNCTFANGTTGLYNLWVYGGSVAMDGGTFTGTRGMKVYTEGMPATAPSVEVKGTTFTGLTEKAAIIVSKAATVTLAEVSVKDCEKGFFLKDIEGSTDEETVKVAANGTAISGTFAITADKSAESAKTEFNITGGTFTAAVSSDYCADGFEVKATTDADGNTVYGVAEAEKAIDLATFVDALEESSYTFDGSTHALAQDGKLTVKWSPVSGCYDTREGHDCTVENVKATANTPKRVNSGLTQFQLFEGKTFAVSVKNVAFVYEPADFTVCENSDWKGAFTADDAPAGQIYLMNTGDVTFEGCTFDKVVLTSFNCTGTSTVKGCSFKNVYNSYAVKDIRGAKVSVTDCTFVDCGAAVMVSATTGNGKVEEVTISGNTFTRVDVASTAAEGKVGTRGLIQIASSGDYSETAFDFSDNTATDCGPVMRQLNKTVSFDTDDKSNLNELVSEGGALYTDDTYVAQVGTMKYPTLAEAIDAAKAGATVKLIADTRENVTIAKKLTLDLNGFTLNGGTEKGKPALTVSNASVTVKDSSTDQTGTIKREDTAENSGKGSHYVIDIQGDGWLTFESGNVTNNSGSADRSKGASLVRVGDDSVAKYPGLNIKGGTFTQDNFIVIKVDRGDLFLNGGTLNSANSYAIENWHRTTIKGGTVNGAVAAWTYSGGANSSLKIAGGTINGDVTAVNYGNAEGRTAKVEISGGTVHGKLDTRSYDPKTGELASIEDPAKATIAVSGGTFDNGVDKKYCADGFAPVLNADGTYGVEQQVVAKIGDTAYYTMDDAFQAVKAGETIVMQRDYTTNKGQNSGSDSFAIDLSDHTWAYTGSDANSAAFEINYPNVTLTVKNGTVVSSQLLGLIPSAMSGSITYDNAGLVFEDVVATANGHSGIETSGNNTDDSVTLKNSTLNVPNGYGIYFPSSGTLTIENSTITTKTMGVQVCSGSLTITDGSAIIVTGDAVEKTENDGAIEDGAAISIVNRPGYKGLGTVSISSGTFTAKDGNSALKAYTWKDKTESAFDNAAGTIAVSGGSFSTAVDAAYCASGFIPTKNADGTYGVKEGSYVAQVGEMKYETIADAIAAAESGDTVTLLEDTTEDVVVTKSITLDLNGKTLTGTGASNTATVTIAKDANVTVKNGTVLGTANSYYTIQNNGTATLEDVTATAGNTGSSMIDNWGTLTINSGTYTGGLNVVKSEEGSTLTINGGTFTLDYAEAGYTAVILVYGDTTINGGEFFQTATTPAKAYPHVVMTGLVEGYPAITKVTGGKFVNSHRNGKIFHGLGKATSANFKVSGGSFNKTISDGFCADGFIPTAKKNEDGFYGVKEGSYVAVNVKSGTKYETLADALQKAQKGNTVKLLSDVTVTEPLTITKAITLDLGGKTITSSTWTMPSDATGENRYALLTKAAVTVKNGTFAAGQARALGAYANLTLTDATVTSELTGGHCCVAFCAAGGTYTVANATITGDYAVANFADNATIAITDSKLEGSGCGLYHNGSNYGLKLTVTDTTVNGAIDQAIGEDKDPSGVYLSGSLDALANAENQNGANGHHQATFTRCTIKGNTGVEVKYTDLTLEDCTVVATTEVPSYTPNNNGMTALGFAVVSTDNAKGETTPKPEGTITITGANGSYTGLVGLGSLDSVKTNFADFTDADYAVSGGTFSHAVLPEYCAAGYVPAEKGDGTYGVKLSDVVFVNGEAKALGETAKTVLEEVETATKDGATVQYEVVNVATGVKVTAADADDRALDFALLPNGTYTLQAKVTKADATTETKEIVTVGVVQVAKHALTILAVPFADIDGSLVTVATLFNAKAAGLADGDTLNVYDAGKKAYVSFAYENGAWSDATHDADARVDPTTHTLARGTAVRLDHTGGDAADAATIALVGTLPADAAEDVATAIPAQSVGLAVNVTTADKKVSDITTKGTADVNIFVPTADGTVQYVRKADGWKKDERVKLSETAGYLKSVPVTDADTIPAGTGYWVSNTQTTEEKVK